MVSEVKFYEFNQHEYYALLTANDVEEAFETYVNYVAGETVEEVNAEGLPDEITSVEALLKCLQSAHHEGVDNYKLIVDDFEMGGVLLVDGSLL